MMLPALFLIAFLNPGPQGPAAAPSTLMVATAQAEPAKPAAPHRATGAKPARRSRAKHAPAAAAEPAAEPAAAAEPTAASATGSVDDHIHAGLLAFRKRRFAVARTHFEEAVAAEPNSAAAHFYLGYAIYKMAEPKRPFHPEKQAAADQFAKAFELDPAFKPAWNQ